MPHLLSRLCTRLYHKAHALLWPWLKRLPPKTRHGLGFVVSGGIGTVTDGSILLTLEYGLNFSPFMARLFSITVTMGVTWMAHRTLTFGVKTPPSLKEFLAFASVASTATVLNYLFFSALLWFGWVTLSIQAFFIAALGAMVFSYCGMRFGVFRKSHNLKAR